VGADADEGTDTIVLCMLTLLYDPKYHMSSLILFYFIFLIVFSLKWKWEKLLLPYYPSRHRKESYLNLLANLARVLHERSGLYKVLDPVLDPFREAY
jgi:hypothetical protein